MKQKIICIVLHIELVGTKYDVAFPLPLRFLKATQTLADALYTEKVLNQERVYSLMDQELPLEKVKVQEDDPLAILARIRSKAVPSRYCFDPRSDDQEKMGPLPYLMFW